MSNSTNKLFAKLAHGFANDPKIVGLSHEAFRAYIELLLYSCQNMTNGFLDDRIVRRMGWDDEAEELTKNDAKPSLIRVEGGYQIHAFCNWQMTTEAHQKKVEAGRAGGLAKAEAQRLASVVVAGASDLLEQTASKRLLDKDIDKDKDKNLKPLAISSPEFDTFWQLWPRRESKATAIKAWDKAVKKIAGAKIIEKAREYVTGPKAPTKEFCPFAATWLNQERWNDEPDPVAHDPDAWMNADVKWGDAR